MLAMPKSSCNPSKRVEDTSLSLFSHQPSSTRDVCTATGQRTPGSIFREAQYCRVHFSRWDLRIANQIARLAFHGQSGQKPLSGPSESVSLSQDHGRGRNRRRHLLVLDTLCPTTSFIVLNLWTVRHSVPDEMLLRHCVLSSLTWPITSCATDSCALSLLNSETLALSSATHQRHLLRTTHLDLESPPTSVDQGESFPNPHTAEAMS